MNGGFPRAYFSHWGRLYAALTVSCLLHAGIVLTPYFGTGTAVTPSAALGALKSGASSALEVRLQNASANARARASVRRGVLPVPAPTYYTNDQLTRPPRPTSEPKLDVPRSIAR